MLAPLAACPERLALTDGAVSRTFAELGDRVGRWITLLRTHAAPPSERDAAAARAPGEGVVAALWGNRAEAVELTLAALAAGLWLVPVNRHLTAPEVAFILEDSGATLLVTDAEHEAVARAATQADGGAAGRLPLLVAGAELEQALGSSPPAPLDAAAPPGGTLIYTSGTTGRPKGVRRARPPTVGAAFEAWAATGRALGLDGSGPHVVTGPVHHAAPLLFALYDQANGAPVVVMPRWDEAEFLGLVQRFRAAHTHLVPTMMVRLLRLPEAQRRAFDPRTLTTVLHGAAPISPTVKRRMIEWWGESLVEYWGATEGGVYTLVGARDWLEHPGTVGRALPSWEITAVDEATGEALPPGQRGVLHCRHRTLPQPFAYHGDPGRTARTHGPHGFTVGDVGRVEADGWVYLDDRSAHVVISGGVNLYPAEIEAALGDHPLVADAAVFGVPDDEWGEALRAAVELVPGAQASDALAEELRAFVGARLARYKVPRSVEFHAALPRFTNGKLHVRALRDPHWAGRPRRI